MTEKEAYERIVRYHMGHPRVAVAIRNDLRVVRCILDLMVENDGVPPSQWDVAKRMQGLMAEASLTRTVSRAYGRLVDAGVLTEDRISHKGWRYKPVEV